MSDDLNDIFEEAYSKYYPALVKFFIRRGAGKEIARELAQDSFLKAFRTSSGFEGKFSQGAWLYSVADSVWKNHLRHHQAIKRKREDVPLEEEQVRETASSTSLVSPLYLKAEAGSPLKQVLKGEKRRIVRDAIDELAPRMRQCIRLRTFHEMSYREIADTMKISVETVKPLLHQAKVRLRDKLSPHLRDLFK